MAKLEQVLVLDPAVELHFKGPFTDVVTSYLKLTNPSDRYVCFKVKTTAPKKYCVRPNSGIIKPKKVVNVEVMLQPFDYNPNEKNKHKFMVQTMFAPEGEFNLDDLWRDAKVENLMDSKLKCVFDMPSDPVPNNNLDTNAVQGEEKTTVSKVMADPSVKSSPKASNVESELKKIMDENKRLKDDINSLKQENANLKEEGLRLRTRGNISGDGLRSTAGHLQTSMKLKESPQLSSYDDKMLDHQQNPMLYLAVILTIGLLGIFIGKFIV